MMKSFIKSGFQNKYSFEERTSESSRIIDKYPDRCPIVVEKDNRSSIVEIDKHKYLVPKNLTIGQFIYVIRKRINLPPAQALFVMTENHTLPQTSALMSTLFYKYQNVDGFLYLTYTSENTFG